VNIPKESEMALTISEVDHVHTGRCVTRAAVHAGELFELHAFLEVGVSEFPLVGRRLLEALSPRSDILCPGHFSFLLLFYFLFLDV
jgi:hypothetical protein